MAVHSPPKPREKREKKKKRGKNVGARSTAADQAGADDTALFLELHGHNSSVRRYPLALNTDGEPYAAETSSKPHGRQSRALTHRARNTTDVAWPPPARAPDHRPEH